MKPLLLPLLAAMVAGCCPCRVVRLDSPSELATGGVGYELPPQGCHKDDCNTVCCQGNICTETSMGCIHHAADNPLDRDAEEAVRETDAEFCKKATEAWQVNAFCHKETR